MQGTNEETSFCTDNNNDEMPIENSFSLHRSDDKSAFQKCLKSSTKTNSNLEKVLIFSQFLEHIHVIEQQVHLCVWSFVKCFYFTFLAFVDAFANDLTIKLDLFLFGS